MTSSRLVTAAQMFNKLSMSSVKDYEGRVRNICPLKYWSLAFHSCTFLFERLEHFLCCFTQNFSFVILHNNHNMHLFCTWTHSPSQCIVFPHLLPFYCWSTQRGTREVLSWRCYTRFDSTTRAWDETVDFHLLLYIHVSRWLGWSLFLFSYVRDASDDVTEPSL